MYTITFNNQGGELDSKTAHSPVEACEMAIKMLQDATMLYKGDSIKIEGEEDDE